MLFYPGRSSIGVPTVPGVGETLFCLCRLLFELLSGLLLLLRLRLLLSLLRLDALFSTRTAKGAGTGSRGLLMSRAGAVVTPQTLASL